MNKKFLIAVLALSVTANLTFAQVRRKPVTSPKEKSVAHISGNLLPTDPEVIIGKLPNGLTYYIRKNTEPKNRAELYLVNKVGSVLETDPQQGLAHLPNTWRLTVRAIFRKMNWSTTCKKQV